MRNGPVSVAVKEEGGLVRITVSDHGPGLPAPLQGAQLMTSLGSTKPQGSGLGLPIAQKILHDHGGSLALLPRPGGGAQAVVELPLRAQEQVKR